MQSKINHYTVYTRTLYFYVIKILRKYHFISFRIGVKQTVDINA